eukprot:15476-Heterococcus_DN1.PRE.1
MGLRSITSAVYCGVVHAAGTSIATAAADAMRHRLLMLHLQLLFSFEEFTEWRVTGGKEPVWPTVVHDCILQEVYCNQLAVAASECTADCRRRHNHEHLVTTTWHAAATTCML